MAKVMEKKKVKGAKYKETLMMKDLTPLSEAEKCENQITCIAHAPTEDLPVAYSRNKTHQTALTKYVEALRLEIIRRAIELKDKAFDIVGGKDHIIDINDEFELRVGLRQTPIVRQGAMSWLERKKPKLIAHVTRRQVTVEEPEALADAVYSLTTLIGSGSASKKELRIAIEHLNQSIAVTRVLDEKLVEQAVKDGKLKEASVKRLYEYKEGYALTVAKKKNAEEE